MKNILKLIALLLILGALFTSCSIHIGRKYYIDKNFMIEEKVDTLSNSYKI